MLGLYMGEGGLYSGRDLYLEVFSMLLQYKPGSHMPVVCLRYCCLQPLMHTVHSFVNYLVELLTMAQPWYLTAAGLCCWTLYSQTGCSLASHIAILSHNIAILIGRLLWAICNWREQILQVEIHKRLICKQSLWLDYKKEGSTKYPVAQTILIGFPLSYNPIRGFVCKSFVNFNLQFVCVGCKDLFYSWFIWMTYVMPP
jgi:hypothetical protein